MSDIIRVTERYLALRRALEETKGWTESAAMLRATALSAVDPEREDASALAARIRAEATVVRQGLSVFSSLSHMIRMPLTGLVVARGHGGAELLAWRETFRGLLRGERFRLSEPYRTLTALQLALAGEPPGIDPLRLSRTIERARALRTSFWWSYGSDVMPFLALHADREAASSQVLSDVRRLTDALKARGLGGARARLRAALLLLTMGADRAHDLAQSTRAWRDAIRREGFVGSRPALTDLALLVLVSPEPSADVVTDLERGHAAVREGPPRFASRSRSFPTAVGLHVLASGRKDAGAIKAVVDFQAILAAQQAAALAATTTATGAATSAGS